MKKSTKLGYVSLLHLRDGICSCSRQIKLGVWSKLWRTQVCIHYGPTSFKFLAMPLVYTQYLNALNYWATMIHQSLHLLHVFESTNPYLPGAQLCSNSSVFTYIASPSIYVCESLTSQAITTPLMQVYVLCFAVPFNSRVAGAHAGRLNVIVELINFLM